MVIFFILLLFFFFLFSMNLEVSDVVSKPAYPYLSGALLVYISAHKKDWETSGMM